MIGQKITLDTINHYNKYNFPRFSIVSGLRGSGKTTLVNYINDNIIGADLIIVSSIADVRKIFIDAPTFVSPKLFLLGDFDSMNFRAKESILKLCEDIPNNVYIIIETNSLENIKQTLISRANIIKLQNYSNEELKEFCYTLDNFNSEELEYLLAAFKTPGDIIRAHNCNILNLYSFCYKVLNNVFTANLFNAMKISNNLKLKSDGPGYDLDLFFTVLMHCAKFYLSIEQAKLLIETTSKILRVLTTTKSINKLMLFDCWLCELKGVHY